MLQSLASWRELNCDSTFLVIKTLSIGFLPSSRHSDNLDVLIVNCWLLHVVTIASDIKFISKGCGIYVVLDMKCPRKRVLISGADIIELDQYLNARWRFFLCRWNCVSCVFCAISSMCWVTVKVSNVPNRFTRLPSRWRTILTRELIVINEIATSEHEHVAQSQ